MRFSLHFLARPCFGSAGLLHVDKARVAARGQSKRFVRQLFPYAVDKHTKHFVLWYLEPPANDDEVNADVAESITK